jgi:hypothetical protein
MKSGNLTFFEPSGPLQACNETALPLPNSALIVQLITLVVLPVNTIETENMMRSRSNKF